METSPNLNYAVLTAGLTLLGGIALFIIQQVIDRVFINPIQKQKETIEEIAIYLIHYAKLYTSPVTNNYPEDSIYKKKRVEAAEKTRELAALLKVRTDNILCYDFWAGIKYVIPGNCVETARRELIELSNSYFAHGQGVQNNEMANKIRVLLRIPVETNDVDYK